VSAYHDDTLGERFAGSEEVAGSIPVSSTTIDLPCYYSMAKTFAIKHSMETITFKRTFAKHFSKYESGPKYKLFGIFKQILELIASQTKVILFTKPRKKALI